MQVAKSVTLTKYIGITSDYTLAKTFWVIAFATLTAIGAQIEIPLRPVPLTLQTFFVLLSGAFLGRKSGFLSMSLYLLAGIVGLPVFAGAGFGLHSILGPSGGYLLAFPLASFLIGYVISFKRTRVFVLLAMVAGLFVIFTLGTIQLNFVYFHNWTESMKAGLLAFSVWDIVKLLAASSIYSQFLERPKA